MMTTSVSITSLMSLLFRLNRIDRMAPGGALGRSFLAKLRAEQESDNMSPATQPLAAAQQLGCNET